MSEKRDDRQGMSNPQLVKMFKQGTRVRDTRDSAMATVLQDVYDAGEGPGGDGWGVVVEYDDEPGTAVSTGTDYFEAVEEGK